MKPVILEMTAFGSYAKPTTVDFQKWNHSLYLIVGDTGARRPRTFDAIVDALLGVVSVRCDSQRRMFEILRSGYVAK